jgi:translation initiation factor IF-3
VAYQKQNYFQRRTKPKGPRTNDRIRASEVQVIGSDGKNCGTISLKEAIELAREEGLDLVEISPNAKPPVCKIIDIGKYKYDLQKKANKAKKKQKITSLKEIKLRPVTEIHDYNFKIKNAQKFLEKGDKVKFTVKFRGREMQHKNLGNELMARIIKDTKSLGKVEIYPKLEGRQIIMIIQPL